MKIFERIKTASDDKKRIYAAIIAIIVTVIIVAIWFSVRSLYNTEVSVEKRNPFESLTDALDDIFKNTEFPKPTMKFEDLLGNVSGASGTDEILMEQATNTEQ